MNNNVNQPEKDIEQLITETLDRCMSGIDTAPSLRPAVDKKLEENPRPEKRHIPVRRFAVPAVALALCVCLIVTGTHFGMFRWPDRIRTPETKLTAQPVPLAQPKGEGGEGVPITFSSALSAAEEDQYDERTMAVFTVLDQFCKAWEQKDPEQMAALCGCVPGDESDAAIRAADTIRTLVGAISPRGRNIENALELVIPEDDTPVTVSVVVTDIPRQAKYRYAIRLLRQPDESWLIDPASLEKCEELEYIGKNVIAVREFRDLMAIAAGSEIAGLTQLLDKHARPDDIDDILMPVNAVCEKDGIRFEVVAAAADEEQFWVLYSLQDMESDRITRYTWYPHLEQDIGPSDSMGYLDNAYIVQDHCQVFLDQHRFNGRIDLSEDRSVTFSVPYFSLVDDPEQREADVLNGPWEVQVPLSSIRMDIGEPDLSGAAQWDSWGTTPMPPIESLPIELPDSAAADSFAQWDSWGATPVPSGKPAE